MAGKSAGFGARLLGLNPGFAIYWKVTESHRQVFVGCWPMGVWAWLVPRASSSLPQKLPGLPPSLSSRTASPLHAVCQPGRSISLPRRQKDVLPGPFPAAELGMGASPWIFFPSRLEDKTVCVIMCRGLRSLFLEAHCPGGTCGASSRAVYFV